MLTKILVGLLVVFLFFEALTWPDVGALAEKPPQSTAFIDRWRSSRRWAGEDDQVDWRGVPYGSISRSL